MTGPIQALLDRIVPRLFAERSPEIDPWFFDYFGELQEAAARVRYARAIAADLNLARFDPKGRVMMDAGSGFGLTLLGFASLGPRLALGLEAFRPMAETSTRLHRRAAPELPALVVRGSVDAFPLRDRSLDFIYCNEALSHFLNRERFYDEAARTLKPGGVLMICDGNNALNRRTVAHVKELWKHFEEGPIVENLHGHKIDRTYRQRRREMIAAEFPGLPDEALERLAWGTYLMHGPAIVEEARRLVTSGRLPEHPPVVKQSPVDPVKGDNIESLVDAHQVAATLTPRGFDVRSYAHFGGARSPLVAAANSVLRAFSPITLAWARSVKIVARRS